MIGTIVIFQDLKSNNVPWTGGASASSGTGMDTFFSRMISLGTSGTLKILILFTIKNLEDLQDSVKSRQRIQGKELHLIRFRGGNGFGAWHLLSILI